MNLSKCWEIVKDREAWRAEVHRGCKESDVTEQPLVSSGGSHFPK